MDHSSITDLEEAEKLSDYLFENEYDVVILNKTKKKYKNRNAYACA